MTKVLTLRDENIPQILKDRGQWSLWTGDKMPTTLDGKAMKWQKEPESRLTWQQVEPFYRIGWFVEPDVGIIVIDFDGCRNKETGEIHPMVQAWLDQAHSYAEVSQSGTGLKLYVLGSIPHNKAVQSKDVPWKDMNPEHTGIEIYAKSRFIAVTGNKLPECPSEVVEANEPLYDMLTRFTPAPEQKKPAKTPRNFQRKSGKDSYTSVLMALEVAEWLNDGVLIECPWIGTHSTPYPYARVYYGPPHTFHCFHTNCANRTWRDVRLHVDPHAYDYEPSYKPHRANSRASLLAQVNKLLASEVIKEVELDPLAVCSRPDCSNEVYMFVEDGSEYGAPYCEAHYQALQQQQPEQELETSQENVVTEQPAAASGPAPWWREQFSSREQFLVAVREIATRLEQETDVSWNVRSLPEGFTLEDRVREIVEQKRQAGRDMWQARRKVRAS